MRVKDAEHGAKLQEELPTIIWMTTPVQHFATAKGEYDPKELGKQCKPLTSWYEVSTAAQRCWPGAVPAVLGIHPDCT